MAQTVTWERNFVKEIES